MRYCKNISRHIALLLFSILVIITNTTFANSNASELHIKSAELLPGEDTYFLDASVELNLSPDVEEALNKGIPLTFLIEFQLVSPRKYWFDDEVVSTSSQITLSYHALSRQYLLTRGSHQLSFSSLSEAKEEFSHLHGWAVVEKSLLKKGESYYAGLRVRLDQSKLPKPLQVEALGSDNWNMISQRYRWAPVFVF